MYWIRNRYGTLAIVVAVLCAFGGSGIAEAQPVEVIWSFDYCDLHFWWNGTWDRVAWYAYACWVLDIPDWAYQYGLYALGWTEFYNTGIPAEAGKAQIFLYDGYDRPWGWYQGGQYLVDVYITTDNLVLETDEWVDQACTLGAMMAGGIAGAMFEQYVGFDSAATERSAEWYDLYFLKSAICITTERIHWPWGYSHLDQAGIAPYYQFSVGHTGPLGWLYAGTQDYAPVTFELYSSAYWHALAWGYFLSCTSSGVGGGTIHDIFELVTALRNGSLMGDAFMTAYGHTLDTLDARIGDPNDMYYYLWIYWFS